MASSDPPKTTTDSSKGLLKPDETKFYERHDRKIPDGFKILEKSEARETQEFRMAQAKEWDEFLNSIKAEERAEILETLTEWNKFFRIVTLAYASGYYYFIADLGDRGYNVLCKSYDLSYDLSQLTNAKSAEERNEIIRKLTFHNPNTPNSSDSVCKISISPNGQVLAFGMCSKGSDDMELYVRDIYNQEAESDQILRGLKKYNPLRWKNDSAGFWYNRYKTARTATDKTLKLGRYFHRIGHTQIDDQRTDEPIRSEEDDEKTCQEIVDDGQYKMVSMRKSRKSEKSMKSELRTSKDLKNDTSVSQGDEADKDILDEPILPAQTITFYESPKENVTQEAKKVIVSFTASADADYEFVGCKNSRFFFVTDQDAPMNKIVEFDMRKKVPKASKLDTTTEVDSNAASNTVEVEESEEDTESENYYKDYIGENGTERIQWAAQLGSDVFVLCMYVECESVLRFIHIDTKERIGIDRHTNEQVTILEHYVCLFSNRFIYRYQTPFSPSIIAEIEVVPAGPPQPKRSKPESEVQLESTKTAMSMTETAPVQSKASVSKSVQSASVKLDTDSTASQSVVLESIVSSSSSQSKTDSVESKREALVIGSGRAPPSDSPAPSVPPAIRHRPLYEAKISGLNKDEFIVKRLKFSSKNLKLHDGTDSDKDETEIPAFAFHYTGKRVDGTPIYKPDGSAPGIIIVYGGFNRCLTHQFDIALLYFAKRFGGLVVYGHIRGGGEYGPTWHAAGMRLRKPQCFDDLIAISDGLIKEKHVDANKLSIMGASNGGLVVAATALKCPKLYRAVICNVGALDLLNSRDFTVGESWEKELGSVDNVDEFLCLAAISPVHTVKVPPRGLPAFLITKGKYDYRAPSPHQYKFKAILSYEMEKSEAPNQVALLREYESGHEEDTASNDERLKKRAEYLIFLKKTMGLETFYN